MPPLYGRAHVPLPTGSEAAAFDARAIDPGEGRPGVPQSVLMENAGREAARIVTRLHPRGHVVVVAGAGNNGGDGMVLARSLAAWGRSVEVLLGAERPSPDPLLHGWPVEAAAVPRDDAELRARLARADVVVDALLGTGVRGTPRRPQARLVEAMNACGRPVVALDVPSGVEADTGATPGASVRAAVTIAFGAPKMGSLLHPGRERSGRLLAVEIGFPPWPASEVGALLVTPGWASRERPRRVPVTHKNRAGRLLVLAGSVIFGGAAVLCARAALRAGAGFVRVAGPAVLRPLLQGAVPEAVFVDADESGALAAAVEESDAVALGPGMGASAEAAARIRTVLDARQSRPALLDADALNLLARGEVALESARAASALLTPHPGEAARLLGSSASDVVGAPADSARALAARWGAATLLKGTPSLVAPIDADAPLLVASAGSSDLARAGMGDVLTGAAAAFLARGTLPAAAGALGLHFTARAGALAGAGEALLPTDVIEWLPAALRESQSAPAEGTSDLDLSSLVLDLPPAR